MTEQQAIEALHALPRLPRSGASLERMQALLDHLGNPEKQFKCIHIAGTNGKGTLAAMTSSILTHAGYKTGLTISPYVLNFRERFQINGQMMSPRTLASLTRKVLDAADSIIAEGGEGPVEFEAVTAIAFLWFARQKCDFAVVETGLGGRYDATNVIPAPLVAAITRIGMDHTEILGDTLAEIAAEKAGIIKKGVPVIIGETTPETRPVFQAKAEAVGAPIVFAEDEHLLLSATRNEAMHYVYQTADYANLEGELGGLCQLKNTTTLLSAIRRLPDAGYRLTEENVREGFLHVCELTGLMGRWQKLGEHPTIICDTGHNVGGMQYITEQLKNQSYQTLHIVIGMVNDKDVSGVLSMLPKEARYYFTQASVKRALPCDKMKALGEKFGLHGEAYPHVAEAFKMARTQALPEDFIFVGGSSFIVADLLSLNK